MKILWKRDNPVGFFPLSGGIVKIITFFREGIFLRGVEKGGNFQVKVEFFPMKGKKT